MNLIGAYLDRPEQRGRYLAWLQRRMDFTAPK